MCGRYAYYSTAEQLAERLGAPPPAAFRPHYNMAPSQLAPIGRENPETSERELVPLKWGLVPHWAADAKIGYKMINARSETAATKPSFRDGMKYRRCLVAADGWYEWKVTAAGKVPTFIQRIGEGGEIVPVYFAGLWSSWQPKNQPDADWLETFTILTREASPELMEVHDRMPVVLPESAYGAWLDRAVTDSATAVDVLSTNILEGFTHHPVSTRVNSPKNDDEALIAVVSP